MAKKLTMYQRIVRNAERGCGTYLTPSETWALARDDAIATVAYNDTVEREGGYADDADTEPHYDR